MVLGHKKGPGFWWYSDFLPAFHHVPVHCDSFSGLAPAGISTVLPSVRRLSRTQGASTRQSLNGHNQDNHILLSGRALGRSGLGA